MAKRQDFSRKIIRMLSEKRAISLPQISEKITPGSDQKYALTRSIKGLEEAGLIEYLPSLQGNFARLTKEGRKKAHSIKLEGDNALLNTSWDGYWRIILLDLPEERKSEREALRYLLKKAGFICVKNSVWISMYPFEHLFINIKKDLELTSEMMIIVTEKIDQETEAEFFQVIKK
jgi:DNA-binding transcriptional regulator PaaX